MKRLVCLLVATLLVAPSSALAQSNAPVSPGTDARAERLDLSPAAAGIDRMAADDVKRRGDRRESGAASPAPSQAQSRSFWRSPWPWVIGGGAVVVVLVARGKDGDGGIY